jgi:hypothetical protein
MRMASVMLGVFAFVSACDSHPREAKTPDPPLLDDEALTILEPYQAERRCFLIGQDPPPVACAASPRVVKAWGPAPLEPSPDPHCPMRVRVDERDNVIAEPSSAFDAMPAEECVPPKYQVGQRRVLRVDDGVIVAYAGVFDGEVFWEDPDGVERSYISTARLVGFARAPSGTVLALGVGRARLGLGGVVALERHGRGQYVPRLVATLPVQPSAVAFDDRGRLVTFAQGFIVRIDERGRVENLHYVARDIGRVSSLARTEDGVIYVGLECGILRLVPMPSPSHAFYEEWWSAKDGASGHWTACK